MERSKLAPFFKRRPRVHYEKSSKNKAPKKWAIKPLFGVYLWDVLTKKIPARGRATQQKRSATHYELPTAGLVRETGLEPVRQRHTHLKRACLPVPAFSHIPVCTEHYCSSARIIIASESPAVNRFFITFSRNTPESAAADRYSAVCPPPY